MRWARSSAKKPSNHLDRGVLAHRVHGRVPEVRHVADLEGADSARRVHPPDDPRGLAHPGRALAGATAVVKPDVEGHADHRDVDFVHRLAAPGAHEGRDVREARDHRGTRGVKSGLPVTCPHLPESRRARGARQVADEAHRLQRPERTVPGLELAHFARAEAQRDRECELDALARGRHAVEQPAIVGGGEAHLERRLVAGDDLPDRLQHSVGAGVEPAGGIVPECGAPGQRRPAAGIFVVHVLRAAGDETVEVAGRIGGEHAVDGRAHLVSVHGVSWNRGGIFEGARNPREGRGSPWLRARARSPRCRCAASSLP